MQRPTFQAVRHGPGEHPSPRPPPDLHRKLRVVVPGRLSVEAGLGRPEERLPLLAHIGRRGGHLLRIEGDVRLVPAARGEVADRVDQDRAQCRGDGGLDDLVHQRVRRHGGAGGAQVLLPGVQRAGGHLPVPVPGAGDLGREHHRLDRVQLPPMAGGDVELRGVHPRLPHRAGPVRPVPTLPHVLVLDPEQSDVRPGVWDAEAHMHPGTGVGVLPQQIRGLLPAQPPPRTNPQLPTHRPVHEPPVHVREPADLGGLRRIVQRQTVRVPPI